MRERIRQAVAGANNLDEVQELLVEALGETRVEERLRLFDKGPDRIAYVAGIVTSDGEEKIWENVARLIEYTDEITERVDFPVFASTCVFTVELFDRINAKSYPQEAWHEFWRNILGSGLVTDVYMTPRWQESKGATDEQETAKRLGLKIHYWEEGG